MGLLSARALRPPPASPLVDVAAGRARRGRSLSEAARSRVAWHLTCHQPTTGKRGADDGEVDGAGGVEGAGGREAHQGPPAEYARRFLAGDDVVRARPWALLEVGLGFDASKRSRGPGRTFWPSGATCSVAAHLAAWTARWRVPLSHGPWCAVAMALGRSAPTARKPRGNLQVPPDPLLSA